MFRPFIHFIITFSILTSACAPLAQPSPQTSPAANAPAATVAPTPIATIAFIPSAASTPTVTPTPPSPTAEPTPTPTAQAILEKPTPIPAPPCFSTAPPPASSESVTSLAVSEGGRIWASVYTPVLSRTTIYISENGGLSWSGGRPFNDFIGKITLSPAYARDRNVFAAGAGGIYRSFNGGLSWGSISPSYWVTTTPTVRQLAVSASFPTDRLILLGSRAAPRGVFASTDGGATWRDWLVDAVDVLLISPNYAIDRAVWVARNDEQTFRRDVMVTTNQGGDWEFVRSGSAYPIGISPAYSQDSTIIWTDLAGGLYVSRNSDRVFPLIEKAQADALKIWQRRADDPSSGWAVTGEQSVRDLVFSPNFAQDRTAFALTNGTALVTHDGGSSWLPLCYWGGDADKPGTLRFDRLAIAPDFAGNQTLYAGGVGARVAVSRDGGKSWRMIAVR